MSRAATGRHRLPDAGPDDMLGKGWSRFRIPGIPAFITSRQSWVMRQNGGDPLIGPLVQPTRGVKPERPKRKNFMTQSMGYHPLADFSATVEFVYPGADRIVMAAESFAQPPKQRRPLSPLQAQIKELSDSGLTRSQVEKNIGRRVSDATLDSIETFLSWDGI